MKRLLPIFAIVLVAATGTIKAQTPSLVIDSGGNTRYVKNVAFTKDGNFLVSVGDDKVIRVWDIRLGKTVRTIRGPVGTCTDCGISALALSPDNSYLAVGGRFPGDAQKRFAVYLYKFESGTLLPALIGHKDNVISLAFSTDGRYLASGGDHNDHSILLWEIGPQGFRLTDTVSDHGSTISCLSFSPNGQWLASGSTDVSVGLWNISNSAAIKGRILDKHHDEQVYGIGFSPDGRFIVSGGQDYKLNLWDANGNFIRQIALLESGITSLAFSPDQQRLQVMAGTERGVSTTFSIPDGNVVHTFKGDEDQVFDVAFSPNGKLAAVAGGFNGEISILNGAQRVTVLTGSGRTAWSVGFARDGNSIAFGNLRRPGGLPNKYGPLQQLIRLRKPAKPTVQALAPETYDVSLGGEVKDQAAYQSAIEEAGGFSIQTRIGQPATRRLGETIVPTVVLEDRSLQIILKDGKQLKPIDLKSQEGRTHKCYTLSSDGRYVITGGERGYLAIYATESGKLIHRFYGHTNDVWAVALSPDDRFLVSASSDQTVKLWDLKSEQYLLSFFIASDSEWVAWTPHGYYTSSSGGGKYFGWQVDSADNEQSQFLDAGQFQKTFYRPDVIAQYLETRDIQIALLEANQKLPAQPFVQRIESLTAQVFDQKAVFAEIMPPEVQILQPADGTIVNESLLPVRIVVSSKLPITVVNVFLNGVRKGSFKGNPGTTEKSSEVKIDMTVALTPNDNVLTVVAATEAATSKPQIRRVKYVAASSPKTFAPTNATARYPLADVGSSARTDAVRFEKSFYRQDLGGRPSLAPVASVRSSSAPPEPIRMTIVDPRDGYEVRDDNVRVRVVAFSDRPAQITFLVNDAVITNSDIDPTGEPSEYKLPLIKPGENVLKVVVSNEETSAEKIKRIVFRPRVRSKPNLVFLGIGISQYESERLKLDFADADARDLAKAFCLQGGPDRMFNEVKPVILPNDLADRTSIIRALEWLNREAEYDNDVRILVLAGHGDLVNGQYYFYGHGAALNESGKLRDADNNSVSWNYIATKLSEKPGITLVFIDTCRSGSLDLRPLLLSNLSTTLMIYAGAERDRPSEELKCIQVGTENQCFNHGAFTAALLEALSGRADKGSEIAPQDGRISPEELSEYLNLRVRQLTENRQSPKYKPPLQGLPDDFFIYSTRPSLPAQPPENCIKVGVPQ